MPRDRLRLPGGLPEKPKARARRRDPDWYADHQAAAIWLGKFTLSDVPLPGWMRTIADTYRDWTATANGAGLDQHDEVSRAPSEWNDAYYRVVSRCIPGMPTDAIDHLCIEPIVCLPDESFLDAVATILLQVDFEYLDPGGISTDQLIHLREMFSDRLAKTNRWRWLIDSPSYSVETHLGPAVGAIFFNYCGFRQPPRCYVSSEGVSRILPFIPLLRKLAGGAPCLYTAVLTLNIVEVSTEGEFLAFGVGLARGWIGRFPDDTTFWIDCGIGKRLCGWLDTVYKGDPSVLLDNSELRSEIEQLLSDLIRVGVAEAGQLETALSLVP